MIRALVPNLELVLTSEDDTSDPKFKSVAPDRLVLQDYQKRMLWINSIANKYDGLMQGAYKERMRDELEKIAQWGDLPDKQ